MSAEHTRTLIETYYRTFNSGDREAFLALLTDDVVHDINQGGCERGVEAFRTFLARMDRCYREEIRDVVVMVDGLGDRAAAEFVVHGTYLSTDDGLPEAHGQRYVLPAGAFFTLRAGKVARISNFYNLPEWTRQVTGG
ncbi:SnoaL-like domain-containing protein [Gluconacetobacter sp. 1b LMG 1731]|uniref:SnoaL-like domain-containing protein n=1 Tax=Gluconacetobacter dulcium TaxID=2729096 RepID=A0A7W4NSM5_9PROT|nr:ketosteroid isomerase-related protein [Gluconacetobacter dulcium]MBB2164816.1 SnoaL-like domain-containing protein [Gluconacetobacter dulcium]MBB2193952.1 SnoaL-like domain-containing protein [Gluconacetobacter dulcium]